MITHARVWMNELNCLRLHCSAQSRLGEMKEQVTMLGESNTDFQTNMEACGIRESEHLEFTQKISEKNARVQSENITLSNAVGIRVHTRVHACVFLHVY